MSTSTIDHEIEQLQKELMEKQARLDDLRRQRPAEPVEDYALQRADGSVVRLSELFGERQDLIVIHNMGRTCPYCTLWADGFNGQFDHFASRAAFVVVSPDPSDVQAAFAAERGWRFPMVSAAESPFTADMGFMQESGGKVGPWPGFSTFHRGEDGSLSRIAHSYFGPGDPYCGVWHLFAALKEGVNDWQPRLTY